MNYWLADNYDVAQQNTLNMVIGYLNATVEHGAEVTAEKMLRYIKEKLRDEETRLNERFPKKARGYKEVI